MPFEIQIQEASLALNCSAMGIKIERVKQVTPAGTHPTLGNAVLPRALQGGLNANNFHGSNGRGYVEPVLPIVIKYEKRGCGREGKCFSQLLDNPDTGRMASSI